MIKTEERPLWRHRKGDRYLAMFSPWVGNPEVGYSPSHQPGRKVHGERRSAELEGSRMVDGTDDFNVLAYRGGQLKAVLWMGEIVEDDPDELASSYSDWLDQP